ncbi:MAG: nucleotidyltransferase family protein [Anaerolineales bacterium]|nr:nucleotidyltransferase family protein [Anaerolineales bacterium]
MPSPVKSHSCCDGSSPEARKTTTLLGLCARAEGNPALYCRLVVESDDFTRWQRLPIDAEKHGLGPLVYTHLKASDALAPEETWRELKGLYLRHRHANAVRGRVLGEILRAFQEQEIEALALKGIGLAHLVYPEPGLRSMRDMDLLVKRSELRSAQAVLVELGFSPDSRAEAITPAHHHHIPGMTRASEGMAISVELHHDIFPETRYYQSRTFKDLTGDALPFQVDGVTAFTLGYEDMLWHVYRHACGPPLLGSQLRFIWVADLASLVDKFARLIDWDKIERQYRQLYNALPLLHFLTPWSAETLRELPFDIPVEPKDVGLDYQGWPRKGLAGRHKESRREILCDTFAPPEWWLRLFYGVGGQCSWLWHRWVRHPLHVLEWRGHYFKRRLQKAMYREP